jgi:hypothetical protein
MGFDNASSVGWLHHRLAARYRVAGREGHAVCTDARLWAAKPLLFQWVGCSSD